MFSLIRFEPPPKGNPKLDTGLNRLIDAYDKGEAEEFAEPRRIELIDGSSVRVIIECLPCQVKAVTKKAANASAEIVNIYRNLIQAVVPITSLTDLVYVPGVRFVGLPVEASDE